MHPLAEKDHRFLWHPFTQMKQWMEEGPVIIESGHEAILVDVNGKEYLDANSSIWTNLHGHGHPTITHAIKDQLDKVAHSSFLGLSNLPAIELAEKLSVLTGLPRVFYSDDGSTAMEVALKMALQYWQHCGQAWRTKFVAFTEAYHGDTIGTMSVGGIKLFHDAYRSLTFEVLRASTAEDLQRLLQAHAGNVVGVCIEPLIQGAAGMKLWPAGMLAEVRRQCTEHNVLLIADEVLTGFGRTGTMFACEQENVVPDLLALAKGLTGGYLPLAATLASEQIFNAFLGEYHEFKTFFHGHSYTGNQLGCAAALANLRVFEEEKVLVKLQTKIGWMREHLKKLAPLTTRQCGFIAAIELGDFALEKQMGVKVCRALRERGVLTRPIGNVVVIMPPYCITEGQLARVFDGLAEAVRAVVG